MGHHQLGAGLIRNSTAISIGQSASPCNLDWWVQFSGQPIVTVTFPEWVMLVTNVILLDPGRIHQYDVQKDFGRLKRFKGEERSVEKKQ